VSPKIELINRIKKDSVLHELVASISKGAEYDPRSFKKMKKHLQIFFLQHSKTYSYFDKFPNLDRSFSNVMKYARRIPLVLPNDGHLERDINNAIDNMERILTNYITEVSNRYNKKWYPK
jgi:hypothetical protein